MFNNSPHRLYGNFQELPSNAQESLRFGEHTFQVQKQTFTHFVLSFAKYITKTIYPVHALRSYLRKGCTLSQYVFSRLQFEDFYTRALHRVSPTNSTTKQSTHKIGPEKNIHQGLSYYFVNHNFYSEIIIHHNDIVWYNHMSYIS